ncbi:YceI family protein [Streptomyces longisporoflavus]|uniref:YceI family protein n=1 Tax=Streptomyces longisporoflavus TaxID=28044 RepID=A0ABW7QVS9_9ACTN
MSTTIGRRELTGDYVIDAAHTRIGFVARHTLSTRVRGQFEEFDGDVRLDGDEPSKSAARLTIRSASLQTRQRQRDDQLRSTFLNTDKHPSITFTSTGVEPAGDTAYRVTGDLTIRGVAKPVTLTVELTAAETDSSGDLRVQFRGGVTINRNDWGVNWNAVTSVLVSPKVTLEFDVIAVRLP